MKKILLAVMVLAFGTSLCLAEEAASSAKTAATPVAAPAAAPAVVKAPHTKSFVGKVEAISVADAAKGTKSEITVLNEAGAKMTFLVKATTTIYDANSGAIALDKIKAGDKVKVKHEVSKEGVEEAMSVRVVQP